MKNLTIIGLWFLAALSVQVEAAKQPDTRHFDVAEFDKKMATMHTETDVPGMAVAVLQDGRILHAKGYGISCTRWHARHNANCVSDWFHYQVFCCTRYSTAGSGR